MTNKPQKPKCFELPHTIAVYPYKKAFKKPYWVAQINHALCHFTKKERAFAYVTDRVLKADYSHDQIINELEIIHRDYLSYPETWEKKGDIYVDKQDNHIWKNADEIDYLNYYSKEVL